MSVQKWFDVTIKGVDYKQHTDTKALRRYDSNKKYLLHGPKATDPIFRIMINNKPIPNYNSLFNTDYDGFIKILENIYVNDLGFTQDQFLKNYKKNPPILESLYPQWYKTRDCGWLYNTKEYSFETLNCSLYVTCQLEKSGIPSKFSSLIGALNSLELLGYDQKENPKILDLCSGMGISSLMIAKRFPNATVYYNELNPSSKKVFKELLKISGIKNIVVLKSEEVDEDLDCVVGFEAVEHIPTGKFNVGSPYPWLDKFLNQIKEGGHFIYKTMWNSEFNDKHDTLGHFEEYEFDNVSYKKDPDKKNAPFHKAFEKSLFRRGYQRVDGAQSLGTGKVKFSFRSGPYVYQK